MKDLRSRKFLSALSRLAAFGFIAAPGFAQDAASTTSGPAKSTDQAQTLDKYVVTGTYLPMSADAPPIPITTVDIATIQNSGESTNLLQVLTKVSTQFSGSLNLGPSNGNTAENSTNGGSQASVRNLPTLVLINGHRVSFSPVDAVGGRQFVDLNMIPVSAVEKIEILTDGASAIYGSDAVGGVVNVILKSDYSGFEVGARYGFATNLVQGHYGERSGYLTGGVSNGKTSITISAEWSKTDPLYQYQASNSAYVTGTATYAGVIVIGSNYYILNPKYNAPPNPGTHTPIATLVANGVYTGPLTSTQVIAAYNLAFKPTSLIADTRKSLVMDFSHAITDNLKFSGNVIYSVTDTFSQLNAQPVSASIAPTDQYNPTDTTVTANNRFQTNPRQYLSNTSSAQAMGQFDGKVGEKINWQLSTDYNEQRQNFQNPNLVSASQLAAAKAADTLDLFAYTQTPAALAAASLFGSAFGQYKTSLLTYDGHAEADLFPLPAGDLKVAAGGEFRREGLSATADINSLAATFNWASGTTINPLATSRNIWGEYGQISIPIVSPSLKIPGVYSLSFDGAVRHEEYAGISKHPTVPLVAFRYQPLDDSFTLRGSYTQSFLAPTLSSLYGPTSIGFSPAITNFVTPSGAVLGNIGQANVINGANPALKPTTAENFSFGFVYSPKGVKGLSFTTDYYRVRESSIVANASTSMALQDVELNGTASQYAKFTSLNNFIGMPGATPITGTGQIDGRVSNVYFQDFSANLYSQKYEGMDMSVIYDWDVAQLGHFQFTSQNTYNFAFWLNIPATPAEQTAGKATSYNGTQPRYRDYSSITYTRGPWTGVVGFTFIPSLTDFADGEHINFYTATDLIGAYTFSSSDPSFLGVLKGLKLSVGVNDVFNRQASLDHDVFTTDNSDISTYSPLGRFVYFEASYKF